MVTQARPDGAPIALIVYPGTYHAFDVAQLQPGVRVLGHWLAYSAPAAQDAERKLRAFLAARLGGAPSGKPGTDPGSPEDTPR